jgi:hypothetical protein
MSHIQYVCKHNMYIHIYKYSVYRLDI